MNDATQRLHDWQSRFGTLIDERRAAVFAWGTNDCASFAADVVFACTGVDPLAPERGAYQNAQEGARRIESYGGMVALGDALFGARLPPLLARVGDVGLGTIDGRETMLVCNGTTWLGPGADGLVALQFDAASHAWRM